jgi:hypothetical protein
VELLTSWTQRRGLLASMELLGSVLVPFDFHVHMVTGDTFDSQDFLVQAF